MQPTPESAAIDTTETTMRVGPESEEPLVHRLPRFQDRLCVECLHCVWEPIDADGPRVPFCNNLRTKEFNHPIGFLHSDSRACELFQDRGIVIPLPVLHAPRTVERSSEAGFFKAHQILLGIAGVVLLVLELVKILKYEIGDLLH